MLGMLKKWAVKAFDDGLGQCNKLGMKLIARKNVDRFLDVGCGDGKLTLDFARVINPKEIYGIEYVDEVRALAEKNGIKCIKSDLNDKWGYGSGFFDIIMSSQSIEHMHNTRLYLEEAYRCLKPSGQLVVLTENLASWMNIWALVFGWQPFSITNINGWSIGNPLGVYRDEKKDENFFNKYSAVSGTVGHVRVVAYTCLKEMLERVGFKQVKIFTRGYLPCFGWFSNLMCRIDRKHGHFLIATGIK